MSTINISLKSPLLERGAQRLLKNLQGLRPCPSDEGYDRHQLFGGGKELAARELGLEPPRTRVHEHSISESFIIEPGAVPRLPRIVLGGIINDKKHNFSN